MLDRVAPDDLVSGQPIALNAVDRFDFDSTDYRRLFSSSPALAFRHPDWPTAFYRHTVPDHEAEQIDVTGRGADSGLWLVCPLVGHLTMHEFRL